MNRVSYIWISSQQPLQLSSPSWSRSFPAQWCDPSPSSGASSCTLFSGCGSLITDILRLVVVIGFQSGKPDTTLASCGLFSDARCFALVYSSSRCGNFASSTSSSFCVGLSFQPQQAMSEVIKHTHYFPEHWRGQAHSYQVRLFLRPREPWSHVRCQVRAEFGRMYRPRSIILLSEILSVILCPIVLCFTLPSCAHDIVEFVQQATVQVRSQSSLWVCWNCSFSRFLAWGICVNTPTSSSTICPQPDSRSHLLSPQTPLRKNNPCPSFPSTT